MKKFLKEAMRSLLYFVARVAPKTNTAVLRGPSSYEDNSIAIYLGLLSRPVKSIVWVVNDPQILPPIDLGRNVRLVKRGGFLDVYYSVTARFLFLTYEHYLRKTPPSQISVNLWHGVPLKAIGKMVGSEGRADDFLVATSDFTRPIYAKAFGMHEDQCIITGQARTDRMFDLDRQALWQRAFPDQPVPEKVYFWLPTFRLTKHVKEQRDGKAMGNIFNCSDFSEDLFNSHLAENNAVCLVKPHPATPQESLKNKSNIHYIDEAWLIKHRLTLYQLTGAVDCLISDISSIIVDFMLLNRPVILLFEDMKEFEGNRGFSLNPITDYLPAKVAHNFQSFMIELALVQNGQDPYAEKRRALKKLFFKYDDANASQRILDYAFKKLLP
ncbi:MAG: CDP-glycerol glycerophosphotransferase family protein [Rhodobacteraceae bacterium]|nr:CDP-glycerol glycerophosphotransferase family protein [Paracoccaceae bacterium]